MNVVRSVLCPHTTYAHFLTTNRLKQRLYFWWQREGINLERWKYLILWFSLCSKITLATNLGLSHIGVLKANKAKLGRGQIWMKSHSQFQEEGKDTTLRTEWTALSIWPDGITLCLVMGRKSYFKVKKTITLTSIKLNELALNSR